MKNIEENETSMHASTYWSNNGRYQEFVDILNEIVPDSGSLQRDNPVELFRVASNAYYDLYNNGLGNAHIRLPPFLDQLREAIANGELDGAGMPREEVLRHYETMRIWLRDYMEAENAENPSWDEDGEDDYDHDQPSYPDAEVCDEPMEKLLDVIIFSRARMLNLMNEKDNEIEPLGYS